MTAIEARRPRCGRCGEDLAPEARAGAGYCRWCMRALIQPDGAWDRAARPRRIDAAGPGWLPALRAWRGDERGEE